jgi:hypothetical protein
MTTTTSSSPTINNSQVMKDKVIQVTIRLTISTTMPVKVTILNQNSISNTLTILKLRPSHLLTPKTLHSKHRVVENRTRPTKIGAINTISTMECTQQQSSMLMRMEAVPTHNSLTVELILNMYRDNQELKEAMEFKVNKNLINNQLNESSQTSGSNLAGNMLDF